MATINKRLDQDGNTRFQVIIRLKGHPTQTATFARVTDAKKWAQHTEAAIREGRHFKTSEAKKHTLGDMIDRYIELFNPPDYKESSAAVVEEKIRKQSALRHHACDDCQRQGRATYRE